MNVAQKFLIYLVFLYRRYLRRFVAARCRYRPTCSEYMIQAIQIHGAWKGLYLGIRRLLRCNPYGSSGYDPVPFRKEDKNA